MTYATENPEFSKTVIMGILQMQSYLVSHEHLNGINELWDLPIASLINIHKELSSKLYNILY